MTKMIVDSTSQLLEHFKIGEAFLIYVQSLHSKIVIEFFIKGRFVNEPLKPWRSRVVKTETTVEEVCSGRRH